LKNLEILLNASSCQELFAQLVDGVIVFSAKNQIIFKNKAFDLLNEDFKKSIIEEASIGASPATSVFWRTDKAIKKVDLNPGFAYIIAPPTIDNSIAQNTLKKLSQALKHSDNIYVAAAEAIHQCLSWRWVAITRFRSANRLEVLSFWDTNTKLDEYEYDIVGTPCEMVVDTNKFTIFSDVLSAFPNYHPLHQIGAQTYAGLVYRGHDNQPLGHIMAMHDHRDVDFTLAEEVINIATLALSSHFQLHKTTIKLEEAQKKVQIDGLTGIGNRHAYTDALAQIAKQYSAIDDKDWTIAIVDLDNLKPLNDSLGHNAGDNFIKLIAIELSKIGRQTDDAFRIGGDEFAIIFTQSSSVFVGSLLERFNKAIDRVKLTMNFPIGASIGIAFLSEVSGNIAAWTGLADERMYQNKKARKASVQTR
jgi:diguanylate cyclase (GGDEF)-like protein